MSLSVIIPSKDISNLVPCMAAVRQHEPEAEIIPVWDASDGQYTAAIHSVSMVVAREPFIYARNVNLGIKAIGDMLDVTTYSSGPKFLFLETNHGDVILLNDDAILKTPGGFSLLQREAQLHPEFGLIAATCNNVGNLNQRPRGIGLREEPRMVCFVCVFIPRTTIERVGLLDERFVGYGFDDDDYCLRVRRAGLKIGIHDGCYVDHGSLKSTFRGDPTTPANLMQNRKIFVEKWGAHPL